MPRTLHSSAVIISILGYYTDYHDYYYPLGRILKTAYAPTSREEKRVRRHLRVFLVLRTTIAHAHKVCRPRVIISGAALSRTYRIYSASGKFSNGANFRTRAACAKMKPDLY